MFVHVWNINDLQWRWETWKPLQSEAGSRNSLIATLLSSWRQCKRRVHQGPSGGEHRNSLLWANRSPLNSLANRSPKPPDITETL
ncbi:protein of unknown function [Azospirillum baldaniorum]|uniref:Uncharacterized protein n=1 Tax=Azospirillum baldaniorum TaxID=1064539 RepID=A0A9P1JNP0_9PROT|nr:protein of unknown function [Azospirillum baldaniorum]